MIFIFVFCDKKRLLLEFIFWKLRCFVCGLFCQRYNYGCNDYEKSVESDDSLFLSSNWRRNLVLEGLGKGRGKRASAVIVRVITSLENMQTFLKIIRSQESETDVECVTVWLWYSVRGLWTLMTVGRESSCMWVSKQLSHYVYLLWWLNRKYIS